MKTRNLLLTMSLIVFETFSLIAQDWQLDFSKAREMALKENKKLIMVFQGSDWCAPCMKLNKNIWNSPEFKNYATEHYIMLLVDFPKKKKNRLTTIQQEKNNKLAEQFNKNGYFPFVIIFDKKGNVLGETGYKKMTAHEYINHLESFKM